MTDTKLFSKYFSEMNISGIKEVLEDSRTYFECTKEVFLNKIEEVFQHFKKEGDTKLIHYKGNCNEKLCNNYGNSGDAFVGNNSGIYISFIFFKEELIKKDNWCICYNFKANEDSIKLKDRMPFEIHYKEKANYKNTFPQYPPFVELKSLNVDGVLPMDRIEWWLMKYKDKFDFLSKRDYYNLGKPDDGRVFIHLYQNLDNLTVLKRKSVHLENAIREYQEIKNGDSNAKRDWVIKYEDFAFDEFYIFTIDFELDYSERPDFLTHVIYMNEAPVISFESHWVKHVTEFFEIFEELFWDQKVYPESRYLEDTGSEDEGEVPF